ESHSDRDQVSIRVSVLTDHLQKYLGLEEIGEQLRVSKWKGPALIGCMFHHGDVIQSMNDLRTGSEDLFFQMLRLSISSERCDHPVDESLPKNDDDAQNPKKKRHVDLVQFMAC
ncbi:unnamed protein product, partial [Ranitomeya imitator]